MMPDIKIKGWSGADLSYKAVPKVWLTAQDSTDDAPVLVPYTYGEAVSKTVDPDFSGGDMVVDIPDGELVAGLTITKPETLIPDNIAAGVTIAGILGAFAGGAGVLAAVGTYQPDTEGRVTVSHGLGVVPDLVLVVGDATTGYLYQYTMSEAMHSLSGSHNYGQGWYFPGNTFYYSECLMTTTGGAFLGAIGEANAETFRVGGYIGCKHDVGKTYTWLAIALK